jgi:hypothetical protein
VTNGKLSPKADIYSTGCVFLEHITWFLLGHEAIEKFANARVTQDVRYGFQSDIFFTLSNDKSSATLKQEVKDWIDMLKENKGCYEYLYLMLDIIQDEMLESDKDERIDASKLHNELKDLEMNFRHSISFHTLHWSERE